LEENKIENKTQPKKSNRGKAVVIILGVLIIAVLLFFILKQTPNKGTVSTADIEKKMTDYVNSEMLQPGYSATVRVLGREGDLYKLEVNLGTQNVTSYTNLDGTLFFPVGYSVNTTSQPTNTDNVDTQAPVVTETPKTAKPTVELFVMSYCPYGIQAEKGMVPTIEALGDSVDFKLRFVYYAMHGKKEVDENIVQYCIQKEEPAKLLPYLTCFNQAGDGAGCANTTLIDSAKLKACYAATDKEFGLNEAYADEASWLAGQYPLFGVDTALNTKYAVGGSPTLIINGVQVDSARDPTSYQKAICNAMTTPSAACSTTLSSASPAPSFGTGTTTGSTTAQCY